MPSMRSRTTQQAANALDVLMRVGRVTERMVIDGTAITAINSKRRGAGPITLDDLEALSRYFEVPISAFLMTEHELLRWVADNGWNGPGGVSSRCTSPIEQPPLPGFEAGAVWCAAGPLLFALEPPLSLPSADRGRHELEVQVA